MTELRFLKIKVSNEGKVTIEYEKKNKSGDAWDQFHVTSADPILPEFQIALDGLVSHVVDICELPVEYGQNLMKVSSVSYSYQEDSNIMGATITAQKVLKGSNAPLVLNTPHKPEAPYSEGSDDSNCLKTECLFALERLNNEALRYLNGERKYKQLQLDIAA